MALSLSLSFSIFFSPLSLIRLRDCEKNVTIVRLSTSYIHLSSKLTMSSSPKGRETTSARMRGVNLKNALKPLVNRRRQKMKNRSYAGHHKNSLLAFLGRETWGWHLWVPLGTGISQFSIGYEVNRHATDWFLMMLSYSLNMRWRTKICLRDDLLP